MSTTTESGLPPAWDYVLNAQLPAVVTRHVPALNSVPVTVTVSTSSPRSRFLVRAGAVLAGVALFAAGAASAGVIWR